MKLTENLNILEKKDIKTFVYVIILAVFGSIFEVLSVGLIVPLTIIIVDPLVIQNNEYVSYFVNYFGIQNRDQLIIFSVVIVLVVYLFKLAFMTFLTWRKMSFSFSLQEQLSTKIFRVFLKQPFIYYSNLNSSRLIQDTKDEPALYCSSIIIGYLDMLSEILIIFGITLLLLSYSFIPSLILFFIIMLIVYFYEFIFKRKTLFWAKQKKLFDRLSYNVLKYVYGSIIEVKIGNKEDIVQNKYSHYVKNNAYNLKKQFFMTDVPRLYLEFIAIFLFMSYILIALFFNQNFDNIIPTSALYAVSAFKILPSLNRIVVGIQKVNFGRNSYLTIKKILLLNKDLELNNQKFLTFDFINNIKIENLNFSYDNKNHIIKNLNLNINYGEIIGIKGKSGEGKTTLVNLILGLLKPTSGEIFVDSKSILKSIKSWQKNTSYAPQRVYILDDTLKKNICFEEDEKNINQKLLEECIKLSSLDKLVNSLSDGVDTNIGENGSQLSGGQIQRIGFARAIYKNPNFLICDEITSSLDHENELTIIDSIKKLSKKMTILLITHKDEPLKICNRVFELKNGNMLDIDIKKL